MDNQSAKIDLSTCLAVNPNLVLRIEDDEYALLFDPDKGSVRLLNQTAVQIWQLLDGQRSLQQVMEHLQEIYDGMDAAADQQILSLANELMKLGAVGVQE